MVFFPEDVKGVWYETPSSRPAGLRLFAGTPEPQPARRRAGRSYPLTLPKANEKGSINSTGSLRSLYVPKKDV